jgi:hypothetical protein
MVRPVLGALAVMLALASCGGDPKADPTPTPSSPATTPVSTTPAPPVMPEAAKANTKAGAVAFVRYYVELINHAQATGEVGQLALVAAPACKSCGSVQQTVADIYGSGGHIEGGEWHATITSSARRPDLHAWSVFTTVTYGRQKVVRSNGATELKGGQSLITFVVRHAEASWKVVQWSRGS